jgi:hypothetical protein
MSIRRSIATGLVFAFATAACGGSGPKPVADTHQHSHRAPAAATPGSRIMAGSSSVALGGTPQSLLVVPHFGTLRAWCELHTGRLSARFVLAAGALSNASIVVSVEPGGIVHGTDTASSLLAPDWAGEARC